MKKFNEIREAKATSKNIVTGLSDADGPFTVVAIKNNKVIKQETTKMRNMLPAIVKMMRKEVGRGVTIGIEDRKGTIRNTFKEDVPANNASSGAVAGLGSEPPVSKAAQKKKKMMARRTDEAVIKGMDPKAALKVYDKLKKGTRVTVEFGGAMSSTSKPLELVVSSPHRVVGKAKVGRIILKNPDNMRGMKYTLYNRGGKVSLAQGDMATIMTDLKVMKESVELDEAWTADSVKKNAEIGSKSGYGINIKKRGAITKAPYKHMLMTMRRDKSVRVTFDHGKNEFEGTPQSVAIYLNKLLGIKESVEEAKINFKTPFYKAKDALVAAGIPNMGEKNTTPPKLKVHPKFKKQAQKIMKKYKGVDLEINHRMPERPLPNFKEEVVNECWDTHVQQGYKMKGGKRVPNCVPRNEVTENTFAGCQVFKVSSEEYGKCTHPRTKNERWKKKLNMEMRDEIRRYAHRNPGKPVIVQDETSGMMSYLILKKEE